MKRIIVATNNAHKAEEISQILDVDGYEFVSLKEAGISSDPEEDADTFDGNARIKAHAAWEASGGMCVIADDSGLVVDALDGRPGVFSSRYAGDDATDAENNEKLLRELSLKGDMDRSARFVCTIAFIDENGKESLFTGEVSGRIGEKPIGDNGFGYDPLFLPLEFDGKRTFAQATDAEKNSISHRSRALAKLREHLI